MLKHEGSCKTLIALIWINYAVLWSTMLLLKFVGDLFKNNLLKTNCGGKICGENWNGTLQLKELTDCFRFKHCYRFFVLHGSSCLISALHSLIEKNPLCLWFLRCPSSHSILCRLVSKFTSSYPKAVQELLWFAFFLQGRILEDMLWVESFCAGQTLRTFLYLACLSSLYISSWLLM